jgi:type IV secretory pathway VirB3-like protein
MVDMSGCRKGVHRSLLQRDLFLGVPTMGLVLVFCMSVVFLYLFRWLFMLPVIVLAYVVLRYYTAVDQWRIEMFLDYSQQKDVFLP